MNQAAAQQAVMLTIVAGGAIVAHDQYKQTGSVAPPFKTVVAMLLLAGGLAFGAQTVPEIAGPFALLILLAVGVSRIGGGSRPVAPRNQNPRAGTVLGQHQRPT